MTTIDFSLGNFENGGRTSSGAYDLDKWRRFWWGDDSPALIVICEAKQWGEDGRAPLLRLLDALSDLKNRRYVAELTPAQFRLGQAIIYDPQVLTLRWFGDGMHRMPLDKLGVAVFRVRGTQMDLRVVPQHWWFQSGERRREDAELVCGMGEDGVPTILAGDLNETASGSHLPQRNFSKESPQGRRHKGLWVPDSSHPEGGVWRAYTKNVDMLVGEYVGTWPDGRRVGGAGYHIVAEIAAQQGMPPERAFRPTTNVRPERADEIMIDYILAAGGVEHCVVPNTYDVLVPELQSPQHRPSDHRRIRVAFEF